MHRPAGTWLCGLIAALVATGCATTSVDAASNANSPARPSLSKMYRVPSASMEPTLPIGTRVVVKQRPPRVGTIVVYHPPAAFAQQECGPQPHVLRPGSAACAEPVPGESRTKLIKRIVAGPGDTLYVRAGHVFRKAQGAAAFIREPDSYIRGCGNSPECNFPDSITIPAGHWFLMGDNRGESLDSRFLGPVPTKWIIGTATDIECRRFGPGRPTWVRRTWREGCHPPHRRQTSHPAA